MFLIKGEAMARPRKDAPEGPAKDRLDKAFWDMLAEMPFSEMTIKAISSRAHVNHNTFYYHYSSLEDMAQKLFDENMPRKMMGTIANALRSKDPEGVAVAFDEEMTEHMKKTQLFARSGSPYLVGLLRASIRNAWLETLGVDEHMLTPDEQSDIDFAVNGEIALMQQSREPFDGGMLARFAMRPLGRGVFGMMRQLEQRFSAARTMGNGQVKGLPAGRDF